jgi:hypothetical protein
MAEKKHGGKRKGAGRKPGDDGPTKTVAVSIPVSLMEGLNALAEKEGWSKSKAVTEAIRGLLKRKGVKRREGESNPIGAGRPERGL